MALPPQSSDNFLREVEEGVRFDIVFDFWKKWKRLIIGALVGGLVALGGGLWWQSHTQALADAQGEALTATMQKLGGAASDLQKPKLEEAAKSDIPGYSASARMTLAAMAQAKGDLKGASAQFGAIAADTKLAQPWRDLALIRQTSAEFDTMKPEDVIARLKPLTVPGNAFYGSAGEMTGMAYLRSGKPDLAAATFTAMMGDEQVPESIRSRISQLQATIVAPTSPARPATAKGAK